MNPVFLSASTVGNVSDILTQVTSVVTQAISWCTSFVTEITTQPLLLLCVIMSMSLFGIHILKSLMGR